MCGIAGQITVTPDARVDMTLVPRTAALLAHRGPDDWGYVVDPAHQVLLLNTRLAVVDVAGGRQPIANEDGQVWITLNGECYGFERQRRWLEARGHRFRTRTDTEVLVHLYEEMGERFVTELRGEYAFVLHDRRRGICLLVRDRFGIKPLVFTEHRGRLLFASEAKALFADESVERELDREHIYHMLGGAFLPQRTFFRRVQQVEPGTYMRADIGRGWRRMRYWHLPFHRSATAETFGGARPAADLIGEFADRLREATRIRLHGDVEVGAYLSGGADSTAVLQAIKETSASVRTFTVGFDVARFDEGGLATDVARRFGAPHHLVTVGSDSLAEPFVRAQWHSETPTINAHGAAKFQLSRLAASHVKVVLTGEGADELLAGYPQFRHQQLLDACRNSPRDRDAARQLAEFRAATGVFSGVLPVREYPAYRQVVELFGAYPYSLARIFAYQRRLRPLLSGDFRRTAGRTDTLAALADALGDQPFAGLDSLSASQCLLFRTELPGYIFANLGDRPEMAHGVEGRTPFLDHELVEFACALPMALKLAPHRNKHVLRCFVESAAPAAAARQKHIFFAPSTHALGLVRQDGPLAEWLTPRATRQADVFSAPAVSLLRLAVRRLRAGTRLQALAEGALVFALSVNVLEALFCSGFAAASRRYAPDPARFDLGAGDVAASAVSLA